MRTLAIMAGGDSSERIVSIKSAAFVQEQLDKRIFECYLVDVRGTDWIVPRGNGTSASINKDDFSFILEGKTKKIDAAIIMIHGTPGENGLLQAYFELLHIPYSTCGVLASALTFNKHLTKSLLNEYRIKSPKGLLLKKNGALSAEEIVSYLGMPIFVKPNESGSSFGVSKIKSRDELAAAIEQALKEGREVILEGFIRGTEMTCGIYRSKAETIVLPIAEIVPKNEFFDYAAKYQPGLSEEIIPARISEDAANRCRGMTARIYDILGCRGVVRMDYIERDGELYFLEVNTVPGMSPASIVPKMLHAAGISITTLYKTILEDNYDERSSPGTL